MDEKELDNFFEKFIKDDYSEDDHELFVNYLKSLPENELEALSEKYSTFFQNLPKSITETDFDEELLERLEAKLDEIDNKTKARIAGMFNPFVRNVAAAAVILVALTLSIYSINKSNKNTYQSNNPSAYSYIIPGSNKAVLILANGDKILLDSAKNGLLSKQGNSFVKKVRDGELNYNNSENKGSNQIQYNTISTPRGGQYQVVLPDGSKVWLNAATTLKFPTSFTGNTRNVELSGEAYFEVAKNKTLPFQVILNNMRIEVLGTHFNIMSYTDERSIKTTLLEGSVKVIKGEEHKILVPGEQADVRDKIKVLKVNVEREIEWKNGNFNFSGEDIGSIMRKVSRWYNVDIHYQGHVTKEVFVGTIPRSKNISEVLDLLELTGLVHFKIEGRSVIVMK